jgi:glycosyltransferase involved in cell wall biosynthesis
MRIAHLCLDGAFTEGMGYQDNHLVEINAADGHDVLVVSDCREFRAGLIERVPPEDKILASGARLVRLPFLYLGHRLLSDRVKICPGLTPLLDEFQPDVILYHGVVGWSMRTAAAYKKRHPSTNLYLDSHEDFHNTGRIFLSKIVQYKIFTNFIVHRITRYLEKILYISLETRDFLREFYGLPEGLLEFYPLGGIVRPAEERKIVRETLRAELGLAPNDIVCLHSGKLDPSKKTRDILDAFAASPDPRLTLLIVGRIPAEGADELVPRMEADPRVRFLGWQNADRLSDLMCASDAYLQPGTQSASLQQAICSGLPVLVHPYASHVPFVDGNGAFVETSDDIAQNLQLWCKNAGLLGEMSAASYRIARDLLDYRKLAARLYR